MSKDDDRDSAAAWRVAIAAGLSDGRRDLDLRWGEALELLFQFKDAGGVLLMLAVGPAPVWVHDEMREWRDGSRPPLPSCPDDDDHRLIAAARAYREARRPGEKAAARLERVAHEYGPDEPDESEVFHNALSNFVNSRGGTYARLVDDWDEWERIYCGPSPDPDR